MPCKRPATLSPLKDCGFEIQYDTLNCIPDLDITLEISNEDDYHAIVRICETSKQLGYSTACEYVHSLANLVVEGKSKSRISFRCPSMRSSMEPGGLFSILVSPLLPMDGIPHVKYSYNPLIGIFEILKEIFIKIVMLIKKFLPFL